MSKQSKHAAEVILTKSLERNCSHLLKITKLCLFF